MTATSFVQGKSVHSPLHRPITLAPHSRLRWMGGFGGKQTLQIISEKTPPMSMTQAALVFRMFFT
jgi:hypothetical protein